MRKIYAHKERYHGKRNKKHIEAIVLHYTSNKGDTAENNAKYFQQPPKETKNLTTCAHFFIDKSGKVVKALPMNIIAYAVGGKRQSAKGGKFYKQLDNNNTVSIELCDACSGYNDKQLKALKKTIKYIKKYCKNAKTICYHYDVNGKNCPPWASKKIGVDLLKKIKE